MFCSGNRITCLAKEKEVVAKNGTQDRRRKRKEDRMNKISKLQGNSVLI
jgi:hypothetical protein